jgi:hypothetical protein
MLPGKLKALAGKALRLYADTSDIVKTECRWLAYRNHRHDSRTDSNIIVSLTSYPARFGHLSLTLKTLLMQSYSPYRLTLWIAHEDFNALPRNVHALTRYGLDITTCRDLRAFNKLIPAMKRFPGHVIVSADDDICYWPTWLEELVSEYTPGRNEVLCHRMHEIRLREDGTPLPYCDWRWESGSLRAHPLNFATGVYGVLYPPNVFAEEAFDEHEIFARCATADDIWYYWMARRNGAVVRKVRSSAVPREWSGCQAASLSHLNVEGGENDRIIQRMVAAYGFPACSLVAN